MSIGDVVLYKITCRSLDRSIAFYERLGFGARGPISEADADWVGKLYGVDGARMRVQSLARDGTATRMRLELIEWADGQAPCPEVDRPGTAMLALSSSDIHTDHKALLDAGAGFVSDPIAFPSTAGTTWLANVRDPDGLTLQLVQFERRQDD